MNTLFRYNTTLKDKAKFLRKNSSRAEILLWVTLRKGKLDGYKFHRQKMIGNYIVDFYCKELQLAIEVDDQSHQQKAEYDQQRTKTLTSLGITVLRFTNAGY